MDETSKATVNVEEYVEKYTKIINDLQETVTKYENEIRFLRQMIARLGGL